MITFILFIFAFVYFCPSNLIVNQLNQKTPNFDPWAGLFLKLNFIPCSLFCFVEICMAKISEWVCKNLDESAIYCAQSHKRNCSFNLKYQVEYIINRMKWQNPKLIGEWNRHFVILYENLVVNESISRSLQLTTLFEENCLKNVTRGIDVTPSMNRPARYGRARCDWTYWHIIMMIIYDCI